VPTSSRSPALLVSFAAYSDRFAGKLSQKADFRNPDEFYHKMHRAKFDEGTHTVLLQSG